VLLDPERRRLLEALREEPDSASGLARRLDDSRQRLNYHLRTLEEAGLVELREERRRGNCVERALTEARELERWFPLEARVEPGEGGEIFMSWKNEYSGTSRILAWDPPAHLRISWGGADDGSAQVTDYHIQGAGGRTRIRVVTSGFPTDESWDDWVEGTRLGWLFELTSLKRYLEHHDGQDRRVVYLRRRVQLSRPEAWDRLFGPDGLDTEALARWILHREPPRQFTALTRAPEGGLLRISTEPCIREIRNIDVTCFLTAWGSSAAALDPFERDWTRHLERLFPEGETV
jgi:DNA-binding transcriptional ArsR family regulator